MDKEKLEQFEKLVHSGEIYDCVDPELLAYQAELVEKVNRYNLTKDNRNGHKMRIAILKEICGTYGEGLWILPPVHANFGLKHVHFGKDVFINFNSVFVDDDDIYVGDNTMFGPNVTVVTANHPISPRLRIPKLQYNKPVRIGKNVWVGAGAIILSGVTIGDNSVIGAGSVVTRDVPPNSVVAGNPAKVIRNITANDDVYYDHTKAISDEIINKYLK